MKKIISIILIFAFLLIAGIILIFIYTLPQEEGDLKLSILESEVQVYTDTYGVPHINAQNHLDGYRALGFTFASERLFQMELFRRMINGSLSEIFGSETLEADKLLRKLELKRTAIKNYTAYQINYPELITELEAFVQGANYFIENNPLPIEFLLLGFKPEKFDVREVLGLPHFMALKFAEGIVGDILNQELALKLPLEKMQLLRSGADGDKKEKVLPLEEESFVQTDFLKSLFEGAKQISSYAPSFTGSNMWLLSSKRSRSGGVILANDPHIGVSNPHIFFEAHLKTPKVEIYGEFIPLLPFAILGHTRSSAWGFTMSMVDDINIYEEKINPKDPTQVMFKGEWEPLEIWTEQIKVKGESDVQISHSRSRHGPIIDGTDKGLKGKNLSLSWSVYHPENYALNTLRTLPYVDSVDQFRTSVSYGAAPGLSIGWGHKRGDIAWWMFGKNPKLPDGVKTDIVLEGWSGAHEIERYYTIDENAHQVNPEEGIIISANFKPESEVYNSIDGYWQSPGRYLRLKKLLAKNDLWTIDELKEIQQDNFLPSFDKVLNQYKTGIISDELSDFEKEVLDLLLSWDGNVTRDSTAASIYYTLEYYTALFALDELTENERERLSKTADYSHLMRSLLFNLKHSFWDNIETNKVELGEQIITLAFKKSVKELTQKMGSNPALWHWGKIHYTEYIHPLGKVLGLNLIYNIAKNPADGGRGTINNMAFRRGSDDFKVVHAPATRRLIDLSHIDETLNVLPTGNSGNPFSPNFSDQGAIYHSKGYRKQIMDWQEIERLVKKLNLIP